MPLSQLFFKDVFCHQIHYMHSLKTKKIKYRNFKLTSNILQSIPTFLKMWLYVWDLIWTAPGPKLSELWFFLCKTEKKKNYAKHKDYIMWSNITTACLTSRQSLQFLQISPLFMMMTNLKRVCGVSQLFVLCEGSKTSTILLQMCALMTNTGLIINVKQQQWNILFWWPCIFGLAKAQASICRSGYTQAAVIIKRNVSLKVAKCICAQQQLHPQVLATAGIKQ